MRQHLTTTLAIRPDARLHIPWQGCWQVRAERLARPVRLEGMHLPLLASEEEGARQWEVSHLRLGDDDAVLAATLQHAEDGLNVTLDGVWHDPPTWSSQGYDSADAALDAARRALGVRRSSLDAAAAAAHFARQFVIDIHDPRGNLLQRFDDVRQFVKQCAAMGLAEGTLFYLAGWDGPFDATYPDYVAAADAGGAVGLARLVESARRHGGEVMPHLNHWGLSRARADAYPQFDAHILRDSAGAKAGWPGALWCGATNPLWYVNPTSAPWLEHMLARLQSLKDLGIRVVMLDQVAPPMGENWRGNFRGFVRAVRAAHPDLVLASESVNHDLLADVALAELWGPVWTAMPDLPDAMGPSRWMADVLSGTTQLLGHLATPAPYPTLYAWTNLVFLAQHGLKRACQMVWDFHEASGVVPTLRIRSTCPNENAEVLRRFFRAES